MRNIPAFISCDWGTTNFRLRLVDTKSLSVLAEHQTGQGIRTLSDKFQQQQNLSRQEFFTKYLEAQVRVLPARYREHLIVLSGMASSSIGLLELDYAPMPFEENGSSLMWRYLPRPGGAGILLISGAKDGLDMMRGEETQAIGLEEKLRPQGEGVLLLPGTHSKHITYQGGTFTSLRTFMTGELFELLARKSIMANNLEPGPWSARTIAVFSEGLDLGFTGQLTASLFSIRARHLLHHTRKEDNYYLLSGMLIGDELSYLKMMKKKVFLAAPEPLFPMYRVALEKILDPSQIVLFDGHALEHALIAGQMKILRLYEK